MTPSEEQATAPTESPAGPPSQSSHEHQRREFGIVGLRALKFSLALVVCLEVLLIVASAASGHELTLRAFILDLVRKLVWAPSLCIALALILALTHDHPHALSIAGLLIAPAASLVAHGAVEGVHALAFSGNALTGPSPWLVALIRALEYACLGGIVGWIQSRGKNTATAHSAAGFVTGLVFGTALQLIPARTVDLASLYGFLAWMVNELLFPVGCGLILYATRETVEERLEEAEAVDSQASGGSVSAL